MTIREATLYITELMKPLYGHGEAVQIGHIVTDYLVPKDARLYRNTEALSPGKKAELMQIAERLKKAEPVQYVLQEAWFGKYKLHVDQRVLIPRPETEELTEWVISDLKARNRPVQVLDIGTGSGCIPISIKKRIPQASVWAIDISAGALEVARKNAESLSADVQFIQLNILDEAKWDSLPVFDVIVSNPPYIPEHNKAAMHRNVVDHEPALALFVPDTDALLFYRKIAAFAKTHLAANGALFFEIHEELGAPVLDLLQGIGFRAELRKDMQQKDRMIRSGLQ